MTHPDKGTEMFLYELVTHGGLAATPKDENKGWTVTRGDVGPPLVPGARELV